VIHHRTDIDSPVQCGAANAADPKLLSSASAQNHRLSRHHRLLPALEQADFFTARHRLDFSAAQRLKNHPVQLARFELVDSSPLFARKKVTNNFIFSLI